MRHKTFRDSGVSHQWCHSETRLQKLRLQPVLCVLLMLAGCGAGPSEREHGSSGPIVRVELQPLGHLLYRDAADLKTLRLHGADPTNEIRGLEFSLYATRGGETMRLVRGWMTDNSDQSFDAALYYLAISCPVGGTDARAVRFGITGDTDQGHSWTGRQREFAVDLGLYNVPQEEMYLFPQIAMSQEVVILNAIATPLEAVADESVEEYRRQHATHARLPIPPPPFGSGRTVTVTEAVYGLHDLEAVRSHTRKTPDVVVSVAVRLLSRADVARAERATSACRLVLRLLTAHLGTHKGKWPSSWDELEQLDVADSREFSWPEDAEEIRNYVRVDFSADPAELWKRPIEELDVIEPVGLHEPYTLSNELKELHETLGATQGG